MCHHHGDAGEGHEDVGDGHHCLVGGDGQSHGGGGVGDQNHGEHEEEEGFNCRLQTCTQKHQRGDITKRIWRTKHGLLPTDQEVRHGAEDHGGDGPQGDDVRQNLRQEVDGQPVVTADVLVTERERESSI